MIPAILSCVFVLYLYRTLNAPDEVATSTTSGESNDSDRLASRLAAIQSRLELLANETQGGDN